MTIFRVLTVLMLLAAGTAAAQQTPASAQVIPLMNKALADYPGKEALMLTVDYPQAPSIPRIGTMPTVSSTYWKVRS